MIYILTATLLILAILTITTLMKLKSGSPMFWILIPILIFNIGFTWLTASELKGWPVYEMPPDNALFYSSISSKPHIYLLIKPEGHREPRLYSIPYTEENAKKVYRASEATKRGQRLVIKQNQDKLEFHQFDHTKKSKKGVQSQ